MQPGDDFEWDKDNEEKLAARHAVDRYEAEQAAVDIGASIKRIGTDRAGNPEYVFVGKTDDGRILAALVYGRSSKKGSDLAYW
jgi:uncharacterized DUF497 family protein